MMMNNFCQSDSGYGFFSPDILQQYPDTCAIKVQQLILNAKGYELSESELRDEAIRYGWYESGYGTPYDSIGNLLEKHGVDVNHVHGASISDIADELSQGRQVIVAVDSGELRNPGPDETFEDIIHGLNADHALLVSGMVVDPFTDDLNVLLTDPGTGEVFMEYSVDQFEDAWEDSGNFMVSVD